MSEQQTRERSTTLLFYGIVLVLAYLLFRIREPFLRPLVWAGIIAALFHPQYLHLQARFGKNRAATISTFFVALIIVVPFVLIVIAFVQEATQTLRTIDMTSSSAGIARLESAWTWVQRKGFGLGLGSFDETRQEITTWLTGVVATGAGQLVANVVMTVVNLFISLFAMFFFFRDGDMIMDRVRRVLPFDAAFSEVQIAKTSDLIRASISSTFIVALIQGGLGGITFAILGLGAPIFWGGMMVFFALLPLGAGVVWVPVAVWLLLTGQTGHGIALLLIGTLVIGLVDNFLRPILLSGRSQMNGLLVFISLLGGIAAFGLLGLVLGPVIMAISTSFLNAYATERRKA